MAMGEDVRPMFEDIDQDFAEALENVQLDARGRKHWHDVVYAAETGFRFLTLDMTLPKNGNGPFPLVVFIHGGAWLLGHPSITNPVYRKLDFINKLLDAGFAVSRISYRFSSEGKFPMQLHDCKAAIRFIRHHANLFQVDEKRIAVMGDSAGGHLAAIVGLTGQNAELEGSVGKIKGSSAVQAVVDWFGPTELLTMQEQSIPSSLSSKNADDSAESRLVGGPIQTNKAAAIAASPISYVHKAAPPFLIQHGTADRLVPYAQSEGLAAAMKKLGCDVKLTAVAGADHCFWGVEGTGIVEEIIGFLRSKL